MSLFGSKKEEKPIRVSDLFSEEDLATVRATVAAKKEGYGRQVQPWVEAFLKATENSETVLEPSALKQAVFASGVFSKLEPTLAPILDKAIRAYKAMK